MQRLLDQFEFYLIKHREINQSSVFELLKALKSIASNPEALDIQVLIMSKRIGEREGDLKRDVKWIDKAIKELNPDLLNIYNDFNKEADRIIKMSFYKPDFIIFILPLFCKALYKYGTSSVAKLTKEYNYLINNDEAVIMSGLKAAC